EAVLAWKQQVPLLMAGLTGALRLLTGLGWPMIYVVAAVCHRRRHKKPLGHIQLEDEHAIEVMGLLVPLLYAIFIWWKGSLNLFDAAVLILIYTAYLVVLGKMPPQEAEAVEDLEVIPRSIVKARRPVRVALIVGLFVVGGLVIFFM